MSRFYWWRRYPKKKKFNPKHAHKLKPLVLQQIEHGDFDESDYKRQADEELLTRDNELEKITIGKRVTFFLILS